MFGIMSNPWLFLNKDLLMHAKRLCALAAISWLLPLIAITTPATLSVYSHANQVESMLKVPFLNFSDTTGWATYEGWGSVSGVGPEISRLFTSVYTSNAFAPLTPPFPNASYDLEFWGPSYKCSSLEEFIERNNSRTWSLSDYNYTSVEQAFYGEVGSWVSPGNSSLTGREYVYNAVSATPLNHTIFIGASGYNTLWNRTSQNARLVCQLYNASYDITVGFDDGTPFIRENGVKNIELQDWDSIRGVRALAFSNNGTCAPDPESNNATICLTYHVFHTVFRDFLAGSIFINSVGDIAYDDGDTVRSIGATPLFHSGLMDCPEIVNSTVLYSGAGADTSVLKTFNRCRNQTLASAIEDLSRNFTYSLMTYRNWEDVTTQAPVMVTSPMNFFSYNERYLLAAYLTAVSLTLVCMTVGLVALMDNGFTGSTAFSAVLLTTRNPDLDSLAENSHRGEKPLPKAIGNTRLQFGIVGTGETGPHAGFGLEGTVSPFGERPHTTI
ncbi:hypothetical protein GGR53DRAFT_491079 [Hypoxylon sp. FL1150]|nr:hypothetical protein GGR53DRAFT_491079 [Hypoxylon sp. FL1150]